jgi:hypothetical protein
VSDGFNHLTPRVFTLVLGAAHGGFDLQRTVHRSRDYDGRSALPVACSARKKSGKALILYVFNSTEGKSFHQVVSLTIRSS